MGAGARSTGRDVKGDLGAPAIVPMARWLPDQTGYDEQENTLIVIGIILLIIGFIAKVAIIWTIGIAVVIIGAVLAIAGLAGREIGGRKHWY